MILATGFRFSFPFLPQYYDDAKHVPHAGCSATVSPFLPLDGSHIRDLYLDQFYLRDPTLAFLGGSWRFCVLCFTFAHSEMQSLWPHRRSLLHNIRRLRWPKSGQIRQSSQTAKQCWLCTRRPWRNAEDTASMPCFWVQNDIRASPLFLVLFWN